MVKFFAKFCHRKDFKMKYRFIKSIKDKHSEEDKPLIKNKPMLADTNSYQIKYVNSLLDNVHGYIRLTEVENEIEKLPVFKRLQDIAQLGLSNRIFPCALHNRYTHSLGVMYIADQMALHLNMSEDERQILRLAGLLHDIGHYPLSHDVEKAYKATRPITEEEKAVKIKSISNLSSYLNGSKDRISKLESPSIPELMKSNENSYHHERIGEEVIKSSSIIQNIIYEYYINESPLYNGYTREKAIDIVISDICAIITGDASRESEIFGKRISIMIQLMHSELDADRIDYLLRDSTFCGASYGNFDIGQLIQTITYCEYKGDFIVGVNQKGIGCAEQFLINRYIAYSQVIYHKYTSVLGEMLNNIVKWLILERDSGFVMQDIIKMVSDHESNNKFIGYTDSYLIGTISSIDKKNTSCPESIYNFINCINNYRALDMDSEYIVTSLDKKDIKKKMEESSVYEDMLKEDKNNTQHLYMFQSLELTKHKPKKSFEEDLELASKRTDDKKIAKSDFDLYRMDRLKDGLAVIEERKNEDGTTVPLKDPYLLVDSDRSMIKSIYGLTYCVLRKYCKK